MHPGDKQFDQVKEYFEKDSGWMLRQQLVNKPYLIKDLLKKSSDKERFSYNSDDFVWREYLFTLLDNSNFVFKSSFISKGTLTFYDDGLKVESESQVNLHFHVEIICGYFEGSDHLSFSHEGITMLNITLKKIADFDELVLDEYIGLTLLEDLDYNDITTLWPFNELGNKTQEFISSYHYFSELENIYRQIKYAIASANVHFDYANKYFGRRLEEPFPHYRLNITSHDRRYLDACTFAVQSIYIFWERIALLIHQYIQPKKLNAKHLSFFALFREMEKDIKNGIIKPLDTVWFNTFLNVHHQKLQTLRHPLVHFKLENDSGNGSLLTMIHRNWITNISDGKILKDMESNSKNLNSELIELARLCKEGYQQSVKIIVEFKT